MKWTSRPVPWLPHPPSTTLSSRPHFYIFAVLFGHRRIVDLKGLSEIRKALPLFSGNRTMACSTTPSLWAWVALYLFVWCRFSTVIQPLLCLQYTWSVQPCWMLYWRIIPNTRCKSWLDADIWDPCHYTMKHVRVWMRPPAPPVHAMLFSVYTNVLQKSICDKETTWTNIVIIKSVYIIYYMFILLTHSALLLEF